MINEPTHFREHCRPSCIDLVLTDQPNLVTNSGVRSSLDPTVKHQIIFCKFNINIPHSPNYKRTVWHFDRAQSDLIKASINNFDWENKLQRFTSPTDQVNFFNECLLNILSNFIPHEEKTISPRDPPWFNGFLKSLCQKQKNFYQKLKIKGFRAIDLDILERQRNLFPGNSNCKRKLSYKTRIEAL